MQLQLDKQFSQFLEHYRNLRDRGGRPNAVSKGHREQEHQHGNCRILESTEYMCQRHVGIGANAGPDIELSCQLLLVEVPGFWARIDEVFPGGHL